MTNFIFDVLTDLKKKGYSLSNLTFILPSKRAGIFLKQEISKVSTTTIFAPNILSIEEFVEELSKLKSVTNTELLFEFYATYITLTDQDKCDSFESFSDWGQTVLQDFNEIDRYLIPQEQILNYLSAIQEVNHWSLENNKTEFVKKYLSFWNKLSNYYNAFTNTLLNKKIGYQGLIYREAVKNIEVFIKNNSKDSIIFLGFNALNSAEETIIQALLQHNIAQIYWDIDKKFIENSKHDAGLFVRHHKTTWPYFKTHSFNWITKHFSKDKNISVFGIPKNVGQAKYIGELLENSLKQNKTLNKTAVILGDENLLIPVLNSLPSAIKALNITMGFPLKSIPLATLFEHLFSVHKKNSKEFYYKDVIKIISNQYIRLLFLKDGIDNAENVIAHIHQNNYTFLSLALLKEIAPNNKKTLDLIFNNWNISLKYMLSNTLKIIHALKEILDRDKVENQLSLEHLYRFNTLFGEILKLNSTYGFITNISTLYSVYKELLSSETLDFQGEPLEGLQIMGVLESRVLDFETVIISSVNEGILPAGKSNNSFIPFDVKFEHKLPTYKEKDAVYTYHFYRLLQRAKHIYILYNTEVDALMGGEKSRFITQLELDMPNNIKHTIIAPNIPIITTEPKVITKTEHLLQDIFNVAKNGFSPSSLTNYMRNPIDFYYQKILKIKEFNDVEETVAANTLGTVVHNTLEDFYNPLKGKLLSVKILEALKHKIDERVVFHFRNEFKQGDISKGKNLIIFEIAKRYILNFLNIEIKELKDGNEIRIIHIEANNTVVLHIPELEFPVKLRGKVDRVDTYNGMLRIIDYKTGGVQPNQVEIIDWKTITTDYKKYSKSFQILTYAYMMYTSNQVSLPIEAGIISFKNLNAGLLKFSKKESIRGKKDTLITKETLQEFEIELKTLILEICNPNIDFIEKDI